MSAIFNKIMLTLDGSDFAAQAAPQAAAIAKQFGCELVLYTSIENPSNHAQSLPLMDSDRKTLEEGIERHKHATADHAAHDMADFARTLDVPPAQIRLQVDAANNPAESVVTFATKHDIDLIVMCTHGRGGLKRRLRGSVAESVLHHAPCPVMLVRAAQ